MAEEEKVLVRELYRHLRIARACSFAPWKMHFVDGVLYSLCKISGKKYGFSGTEIFIYGPCGERIQVDAGRT